MIGLIEKIYNVIGWKGFLFLTVLIFVAFYGLFVAIGKIFWIMIGMIVIIVIALRWQKEYFKEK